MATIGDNKLKELFASKKYALIDRKGNLRLTNMPRIAGIGRARLSTRKIIAGQY